MTMIRYFFLAIMVMAMTGCVPKIPQEALMLPPESLANRQLQTRYYDTGNEDAVLIAANAVLLDLGFNLDETSFELGVVVGSKTRDATDDGQKFMLALLSGLAQNPNAMNAADATQLIKASLVVRSLDNEGEVDTDLTSEQIEDVRTKVFDILYAGLLEKFPKDTCTRIAQIMAENTAETLANDLDTLLAVKDAPGNTAVRVTFQRVVYNQLGQVNSQAPIHDIAIYQEFYEKLSKSLFLEANQI